MAAASNFSIVGSDFDIPDSESVRFDATEFLIKHTTATNLHDHSSGLGLGVKRVQTGAAPAAAGEVRVNTDDYQWWGSSAAAVQTAVRLAGAQTITGAKTFSANVYVGATANAFQTLGLTIDQGAADDEAVALRSSDVAHGITSQTDTSTYGTLSKVSSADGGLKVSAYTETAGSALWLRGVVTTANTTRGTTALAGVYIGAELKSGTSSSFVSADGNLLVVANGTSARALVDAEGDLHLDATSNINAWDDHDDLALLEAFRVVTAAPPNYRLRFATDVAAHAAVLHETGVLALNDDGHHFVSVKGMFGLLIDALRQTGGRVAALEARLALAEGA